LIGDRGQEQPLCIACWSLVEDIQFRKWLQLSAMSNQALDDMDAMMPFGSSGGRIPVSDIARAASRSRTYNNIHITNSSVGVLNTGNLARIDAAITMSVGTETAEFGARLKDLTDAIVNDSALNAELKQQMIEVVQAISDQAIGNKKPSEVVVTTLFGRLRDLASNATVIAGAVEKLHQAWLYVKDLF
jgi:hypothetical protein